MPSREADNLPARLAALEDRAAIADVIHAYAWHFDRNEPDAVADLFTQDARVDYGPDVPDIHGRAAIRAGVAKGLAEIFAATSHHVSNIRIVLSGDAARSTCLLYGLAPLPQGGAPDGRALGAKYHHEIRAHAPRMEDRRAQFAEGCGIGALPSGAHAPDRAAFDRDLPGCARERLRYPARP